jgi:hypothetical protein
VSDAPGRYRKLYPRLWRHPRYRALSGSARELTHYVLTGPQANRIGLFHFSIATAAEDLGVSVETCRTRLRDVAATFGWFFDADARVFYIPSWWRWNRPENPDVLKGNLKDLSDVPPSGLCEAFARNLEFLPDTWHQTFVDTCRARLHTRGSHQEQEQEQGSEQEQGAGARARAKAGSNPSQKPKNEKHGDGTERNDLLPVAREVLKLTNPAAPIDHLLDTFFSLKPNACSKTTATEVLNVALSERRSALHG